MFICAHIYILTHVYLYMYYIPAIQLHLAFSHIVVAHFIFQLNDLMNMLCLCALVCRCILKFICRCRSKCKYVRRCFFFRPASSFFLGDLSSSFRFGAFLSSLFPCSFLLLHVFLPPCLPFLCPELGGMSSNSNENSGRQKWRLLS